jgi:hypothetical protein
MICSFVSCMNTRSSNPNKRILTVPKFKTREISFLSKHHLYGSFIYVAPWLWNSLPIELPTAPLLDTNLKLIFLLRLIIHSISSHVFFFLCRLLLHLDLWLYPRKKMGILWFWSCPLLPQPRPETVWFPEATDHNFKGIVFIFGIHLWGVKDWPPIKFGHGRVIPSPPPPQGAKTNQIKHFSYFYLCILKKFVWYIYLVSYL